jgi:hypothetical protein
LYLCRFRFSHIYHCKQVQLPCLAGDFVRCWNGTTSNDGLWPTTGWIKRCCRANSLVRTLCSTDSTGKFSCITGDCGSSKVECTGSGAIPPATLAEFTLNGAGGMDFYDVSLVDGYNLPMLVEPHGSGGNCTTAGCSVDLNGWCPTELKVKIEAEGESSGEKSVACKSACEAFGDPLYCCSGAYATPQTCKPSSYSQFFKSACPRAYSYAYDDGTSTFTCASADYLITFCPIHSNRYI